MSFKNHFGLDIGSASLKAVQVSLAGKKFKLESFGLTTLPKEARLSRESTDVKPLAEAIKSLVKQLRFNTHQVAVSLAESQIYTRVVQMPTMSDSEVVSALQYQIEQFVPLPADQITIKHTVISRGQADKGAAMDVLIVAAPNFLIDRYQHVVEQAGLELYAIDTEILSCTRVLVSANPNSPPTLLVNIGSQSSDLALVSRGNLVVTRSVATGGAAIDRAIAAELDLDPGQAEEYKKTYGLDESKLGGSVARVVRPVLDLVVSEMKRTLVTSLSAIHGEAVKRVVLVGSGSLIPGLVPYLASQLSLEVELGNPFTEVEKTASQEKDIGDLAPAFADAVGLAMKLV